MHKPTPNLFMGGFINIVYKINLNSVIVQELNYHANENVYNKPITKNGL
jgi:uncharacterized protein YkvS